MNHSRRAFLQSLTAASSLALLPEWAKAQVPGVLPTPNFTRVIGAVAGLRPMRDRGIRIEREVLGLKTLVHNYGHGGSGFTLAWGSAEEAANLVDRGPVAVIGAGVVGLSTARTLIDRGYKVNLYYADISPRTTSDVAGAQWSPSFVGKGSTPAEQSQYERIVARSYERYADFENRGYGVSLRPNYIPDGNHDGLQDVAAGVLRPARRLAQLPFHGVRGAGTLIYAWLIEPKIFLPGLIRDLRQAGCGFQQRRFASVSELAALSESTIVNCTGLGARELVRDSEVYPMKGQLVHLAPQAGADYILLQKGYIFCRRDAIVLGGSYERNVYDVRTSDEVTRNILRINKALFSLP